VAVTTLFFDLDGTVTNNDDGIARCLNYALEQLGFPALADDEVTAFIGPPFRESLPRRFPGIDAEAALHYYRHRYEHTGWRENSLYDGMAEVIRQLHLQGFTVALCTSKPRVFAEKILDHFQLTRYFDGIHGPELDGRFDHKSDLLAHLLAHYKVAPANAVMIGDRDKDIMAALQVGVHPLGVLWGFGSRDELLGAGAERLIDSPAQLVHTVHSIT